MRYPFISVKAVIDEWMTRRRIQSSEINPEELLTFASAAANRLQIRTQLQHNIAILKVEDYVAFAPENFAAVIQAAWRPGRCEKRKLSEKVVSWSKRMLDGCEVELNLKCPKCHELNCDCPEPIIRVEANRVWEATNPQLYTHYMGHFRGYGNLNARGDTSSIYHDDFILMSYRSNSFGSAPFHIGECVNVNLDCHITYEIDLPHILTNVRTGNILLSYAGWRTDKDGIRMIPDNEYIIDAVVKWIEKELAYIDYAQKKDVASERFYDKAEIRALMAMNKAKELLKTPEPDELLEFMDNHWRKLIPYRTWRRNHNRPSRDTFRYPRESYNSSMSGIPNNHTHRNH